MTSDQARVNKIRARLPLGFRRVGDCANDCVNHLVSKKGISYTEAEKMVLEILKESDVYLREGMYDTIIATLRMTFMDVSLESAASDVMKSLLD